MNNFILFSTPLIFFVFNFGLILGYENFNAQEKLIFLICGCILLLKHRVNKGAIFAIFLMVFFASLAAVFAAEDFFSIDRFSRAVLGFSAILLFPCIMLKFKDTNLFLKIISGIGLLSVVLGFIYSNFGMVDFYREDYLGVTRLTGSFGLAAFLAATACASYISSLALYLHSRSKLYLLLSALNFVIILLTASRGPLAFAIAFSLVLFISYRNVKLLTRVNIIAGFCFLVLVLFSLYGDGLFERVQSGQVSGRDLIWEDIFQTFQMFPYFGVGFGHQILVIGEDTAMLTTTMAAHNEYLRLLVELGSVGLIFFILALIYYFFSLSKPISKNLRFCFISLTILYMLFSFVDNTFSATPLLMIFVSGYFSVYFLGFGYENA